MMYTETINFFEMTEPEIVKFLSSYGIDLSNMSYNELNYRISIANKIAEESFKEHILKLCGYWD